MGFALEVGGALLELGEARFGGVQISPWRCGASPCLLSSIFILRLELTCPSFCLLQVLDQVSWRKVDTVSHGSGSLWI